MRVLIDTTQDHGQCPYLPDRDWGSHMLWIESISSAEFRQLLERGYRRSGRLIYRPACGACRECTPTRLDLARFHPDRSQRRAVTRNQDLTWRWGRPRLDQERLDLHNRYVIERHGKHIDGLMDPEDYLFSMVETPVVTGELTHWYSDGRLAALAIVDVVGEVWSSVFTFFDPDASRRSLGVLSIMRTIELARQHDATWLHLGFTIRGARSMTYKTRYRPLELLDPDGVWHRYSPPD
jgi:arginyl-tRNA--protein-N-Asp/Glu arginylyltransferase